MLDAIPIWNGSIYIYHQLLYSMTRALGYIDACSRPAPACHPAASRISRQPIYCV
ncbi:hypothetical protein BD310DRAFT_941141 [Dichomitus squalens]|uniref:Uncharacterized protein n=1 Tax=Dichomitus squalens TaxID=114155 RepID=A0A4Q9PH44_9APHY|nr:hypothetical protein BD310DRAFT_941141 [Dichomitus squalens]